VHETGDFERTRAAGLAGCGIIREGIQRFGLDLPDKELRWLDRIEDSLDEYSTEDRLMEEVAPEFEDVFLPAEYGL